MRDPGSRSAFHDGAFAETFPFPLPNWAGRVERRLKACCLLNLLEQLLCLATSVARGYQTIKLHRRLPESRQTNASNNRIRRRRLPLLGPSQAS